MTTNRYDPRVLAWINHEREHRGKPTLDHLPLGIPGDPLSCVIARGLGDDAFVAPAKVGAYFSIGDNEDFPLPDYVNEFANAFDAQEFPELIA